MNKAREIFFFFQKKGDKIMRNVMKCKPSWYECPKCGWNAPEDEYVVFLGHVFQIRNFWDWKHPSANGSYSFNKKIVKQHGHKFFLRFTLLTVYPIRCNGQKEYDYYSGVSYESWDETHKCPKHGLFQFRNANA